MGKLSADIGQLQQASGSVSAQMAEIESIIVDLNVMLNELASSWDGAASEAFIAGLRSQRDKAIEMRNCLESYQQYVRQTTDKMIECDQMINRILAFFPFLGNYFG